MILKEAPRRPDCVGAHQEMTVRQPVWRRPRSRRVREKRRSANVSCPKTLAGTAMAEYDRSIWIQRGGVTLGCVNVFDVCDIDTDRVVGDIPRDRGNGTPNGMMILSLRLHERVSRSFGRH